MHLCLLVTVSKGMQMMQVRKGGIKPYPEQCSPAAGKGRLRVPIYLTDEMISWLPIKVRDWKVKL